MRHALLETQLALPNRRSGKVRDLYDIELPDGEPGLLIVATDRASAFDVVMANGLPGKGIVLTQISAFWFEHFSATIPNHLVSTEATDIAGLSQAEQRDLQGRVMLCRRADVLPIECIARGYLAGSGWKDYRTTGEVCGLALPPGLQNGDRLEEPLFTPSTKAETGHDENISFAEGAALVGAQIMQWLQQKTLLLYSQAREYAQERGIILADTKFEFGIPVGSDTPILIDEILTPDSSRFWPVDQWRPGGDQPSFDKQYIRDYLQTLVEAGVWDKAPPGPVLPEEIVASTMNRYCEAFRLLTGKSINLSDYGY